MWTDFRRIWLELDKIDNTPAPHGEMVCLGCRVVGTAETTNLQTESVQRLERGTARHILTALFWGALLVSPSRFVGTPRIQHSIQDLARVGHLDSCETIATSAGSGHRPASHIRPSRQRNRPHYWIPVPALDRALTLFVTIANLGAGMHPRYKLQGPKGMISSGRRARTATAQKVASRSGSSTCSWNPSCRTSSIFDENSTHCASEIEQTTIDYMSNFKNAPMLKQSKTDIDISPSSSITSA